MGIPERSKKVAAVATAAIFLRSLCEFDDAGNWIFEFGDAGDSGDSGKIRMVIPTR